MSLTDALRKDRHRQPRALDGDERDRVLSQISRSTTGLRPDIGRLTPGEQRELLELVRQIQEGAERNVTRFSPAFLPDSDRLRWEALVEKAADTAGVFQRQREEEDLKTKMAALAARARRPAQKPALLPAGTVVLQPEFLEDVRDGFLWLGHAAVIVALQAQFETATSWSPHGYFEGSAATGDLTLVFESTYGPFGAALGEDGENFAAWKLWLEELEQREWFEVDRSSLHWRITRGPRALADGKAAS